MASKLNRAANVISGQKTNEIKFRAERRRRHSTVPAFDHSIVATGPIQKVELIELQSTLSKRYWRRREPLKTINLHFDLLARCDLLASLIVVVATRKPTWFSKT